MKKPKGGGVQVVRVLEAHGQEILQQREKIKLAP
jgi:hypothetical protein